MAEMTINTTFKPKHYKQDTMKEIAIIAYSGISLFHLSVPIAIFNDALAQKTPLFNVKICAEQPGTINSANGLAIDITESTEAIKQADIIIFPS